MAEHDPISTPDIQIPLQLLEYLQGWADDLFDIKPPNQIFEGEKSSKESILDLGRIKARKYVSLDPAILAEFNEVLEHIISSAIELGRLDPGCDCNARERRKNYNQQVREHRRKLRIPARLTPKDLSHSSSPSPLPSAPSNPSGGDKTPPDSSGSTGGTDEEAADPSAFGGQTASLGPSEDPDAPPGTESLDDEELEAVCDMQPGQNLGQSQVDANEIDDGIVPDSARITAQHEQVSMTQVYQSHQSANICPSR